MGAFAFPAIIIIVCGFLAGIGLIISGIIVFIRNRRKYKDQYKKEQYKAAAIVIVSGLLCLTPVMLLNVINNIGHIDTGKTIYYSLENLTYYKYFEYDGKKYIDFEESFINKEYVDGIFYDNNIPNDADMKPVANLMQKKDDIEENDSLQIIFLKTVDNLLTTFFWGNSDEYIYESSEEYAFDFVFVNTGEQYYDIFINVDELKEAKLYYTDDSNFEYRISKIKYYNNDEYPELFNINISEKEASEINKNSTALSNLDEQFSNEFYEREKSSLEYTIPPPDDNSEYEILDIDLDEYIYYNLVLESNDNLISKWLYAYLYLDDDKLYQDQLFDLNYAEPKLIAIPLSDDTSKALYKQLSSI